MQGLYEQLMALPEPFYHVDREWDGVTYRIFGYRHHGDPEVWKLPGALECRGHMFEIEPMLGGVRLVSLPLPKFFNFGENDLAPVGMGGNWFVLEKLDGSLISTFDHLGRVELKSKMSLDGEQVVAARQWLSDEQRAELQRWTDRGFTICLEWVSPNNRIVVEYDEARLVPICARKNNDADVINWAPILLGFERLQMFDSVSEYDIDREGVEGVVVVMANSVAKLKGDWYRQRHRIKSIASDKHFVRAMLERGGDLDRLLETLDDFPDLLARYQAVREVVIARSSWMRGVVELFYIEHHELDRKSYALAGQALPEHLRRFFPLLMQMYSDVGSVTWTKFSLKHMDWLFLAELDQEAQ